MKIMTFNIRCDVGTTLVGEADYWPSREILVEEMLHEQKPDIVGVQEMMDHQIASVQSGLGPNYNWAGDHRERTDWFGERNPIFYNTDVVDFVRTKTYALSDTPNILGSVTWNNKDPRIFTCIDFQDKATKKLFTVVNTHFDHVSDYSRLQSAYLLERMLLWCKNVVILGDFNAVAGASAPYSILTKTYRDAYLAAKIRLGRWGTLPKYKDPVAGGERYDWILCDDGFEVNTAGAVTYNVDGYYPSDHLPVTVTVNL